MGTIDSITSSLENTRFRWITYQRFYVYLIAVIIRVMLSIIFIDWADGPVFFEAGEDIIKEGSNIYPDDTESPHYLFNYFPLAYLAILPGLILYYLIGIDNLYLQRFFLKLPFIIGDIILAILINRNSSSAPDQVHTPNINTEPNMKVSENISTRNDLSTRASKVELFILFNPFIIATSSIKGQFDIIPVIFLYIAWIKYKREDYYKSGILIGISILFKQYGILFSFILGLNLLKTNLRKFVKFFLGHLLIMIPIISIAALLNFEGLRYHAITYHLDRPPSGYSLTSIFFYSVTIFSRENYSSLFSNMVGYLIEVAFFSILLYILLYFAYRLWISENEHINVINSLLLVYTGFYLFNNVFWIQYFIIFMILWVEWKKLMLSPIVDTSLNWCYATLPFVIVFRVSFMVPADVQKVIGDYWIEVIWLIGVITHFVIMFLFKKQKRNMFEFRFIKPVYIFGLILLPIHFLVMREINVTKSYFIL